MDTLVVFLIAYALFGLVLFGIAAIVCLPDDDFRYIAGAAIVFAALWPALLAVWVGMCLGSAIWNGEHSD